MWSLLKIVSDPYIYLLLNTLHFCVLFLFDIQSHNWTQRNIFQCFRPISILWSQIHQPFDFSYIDSVQSILCILILWYHNPLFTGLCLHVLWHTHPCHLFAIILHQVETSVYSRNVLLWSGYLTAGASVNFVLIFQKIFDTPRSIYTLHVSLTINIIDQWS